MRTCLKGLSTGKAENHCSRNIGFIVVSGDSDIVAKTQDSLGTLKEGKEHRPRQKQLAVSVSLYSPDWGTSFLSLCHKIVLEFLSLFPLTRFQTFWSRVRDTSLRKIQSLS